MMQNSKKRSGLLRYDFDTAGRGPARWGLFVMVPFLIAITVWATFAPINAAAIAEGEVVLNQDRKTIQHLEGGIVEEILISEGASVKRGDAILVIRDIAQRTRMNTITDQLASAKVRQARLIAERDGLERPDFNDVGKDLHLDPTTLDKLIEGQLKLFETRRNILNARIDLIEARKVSIEREIDGLKFERASLHERKALTLDELKTVETLYQQQLATGTRKTELKQNKATLDGQIGSLSANIERLNQSIVSAGIEIIDLQSETRNGVLDELQAAELSIQELTHQLTETTDQLARTTIHAPVDGKVIDLQVHTKGAVLQPGERILDLVPNDDRLIIEARLNPNDIDLVSSGTQTKVLLSAYKAKKVPKLDGEVLGVSADILSDQVTGERYFLARVLVDDTVLKDLKADVALYPGMPAQVFLIAGERTVADYLLSPVADATYRAFREE